MLDELEYLDNLKRGSDQDADEEGDDDDDDDDDEDEDFNAEGVSQCFDLLILAPLSTSDSSDCQ